jgi:Family of unknown function (DUF6152)
MKKLNLIAMLAIPMLAPAPLTLAHHSAAMFDKSKEVTLQGTMKEFQYTNPHSWVVVDIPDADGKVTVWSFETRNASALLRSGIRRSSLVAGDKVTVKGHPLRDGRPGAELIVITKDDGTILKPE